MNPNGQKRSDLYAFGPFLLDVRRGILRRSDELVNLPPKVFETLCLLVEQQGEVVSKRVLMESLWPDSYVEESNLTQNVFLLRKTLGKTEAGADFIETLSKRGYRLSVPVEARPGEIRPREEVTPATASGTVSQEAESVLQVNAAQTLPPSSLQRLPSPKIRRWAWVLGASAGILALVGWGIALRAGWPESEQPVVLRFSRLTNDGTYKEHLTSLLSDGTRVYFSETVGTTMYLAEAAVIGGETTRREGPYPAASAVSYSRLRNEILFGSLWEQSSERPLTVMSLPGGATHLVGDLKAHAASWSPDGNYIAYAEGRSLYTALADGSEVHEIARLKDVPYWPRWSPDGRRIRFSTNTWGQGMTLWEIRANGQELHPLFPHEAWAKEACCGDWSPDGRYYVFVVEDARQSSLWAVRDMRKWWQADKPIQLAEGPVDFWRAPLVAPDGKHIFALGEHARGELLKYNPKSQEFRPYLGGLSTDTIAFSRDGQWIAYTAYPEGTLWRSRVDGSDRLKLTNQPEVARFPQWSPDGSQIVYIAAEAGKSWKIHKVSSNGGKTETVLPDSTSQGVATWSPDGTRIAFGEIIAFGVDQQRKEQIRILNLKQGTATVIPGSDGLWTARWSPDGRYLSAVTTDNRKLMLYDFHSGQWSELANVGTNDVVWSLDGGTIYFDCPNEPVVYRVDVKSRRLEKYIPLNGLRRTGFFGWSLNIAPDNNPMLLREAGVHEVYSLQVSLP